MNTEERLDALTRSQKLMHRRMAIVEDQNKRLRDALFAIHNNWGDMIPETAIDYLAEEVLSL